MTFDTALRNGLVLIDTDGWREKSLTSMMKAAYPSSGFSRFVCSNAA
ncbi:hypothetical protein [Rhizobium ruizarguesonis]|jgi:hypothetical protein|nr:hypothetical protein [Rhizobium ruizarguesonis]